MTPITWRDAERVIRCRLDRRRAYGFDGGKIWILIRYTLACSGCAETPEMTATPDRGVGCSECRWSGRRRYDVWAPLEDELCLPE